MKDNDAAKDRTLLEALASWDRTSALKAHQRLKHTMNDDPELQVVADVLELICRLSRRPARMRESQAMKTPIGDNLGSQTSLLNHNTTKGGNE